jgi:hypothetical protein
MAAIESRCARIAGIICMLCIAIPVIFPALSAAGASAVSGFLPQAASVTITAAPIQR